MEERTDLPEEELPEVETPEEEVPLKPAWQMMKESWYSKLDVTVKQLDIFIGICLTLLALTFVAIALDAMGIF